jgi:hypothetical protein
MVAGRPQNFISQTTYETINFTTQLQVSTLGNAYPLYSSITRTVSSISANEVPGREIFVSTFFQPGQICIRTVSDPFNLISGDSNLNTSTIQSFGQWTALEGLEPENIVANSVSTTLLVADVAIVQGGFFDAVNAREVRVTQDIIAEYQAPLTFLTGSVNEASFVGELNRLYCYNDTGYIFSSERGGTQQNASLNLGSNADESFLTVSSIACQGNINAVSAFISSLTVESLFVVSTINLTSTSQEFITSTQTLEADTAFINQAFISTLDSFTFGTGFNGPFDFGKSNLVVSTSYAGVASLTNNILNYSLTTDIQDMASFNLYNGTPINYNLFTTNVGQWASTILNVNSPPNLAGTLIAAAPSAMSSSAINGTFDVSIPIGAGPFTVTQFSGGGISTIVSYPVSTSAILQRFLILNTGFLTPGAFNPAPYETINSNIFTITQDMNDVFITTTDRLVLTGGDIVLNGALSVENTGFANINSQTATISSLNSSAINVSTLRNYQLTASNVIVDSLQGLDMNFFKPSTISYTAAPTTMSPQTMNFTVQTADFLNVYPLIPPFMGSNSFTSYNVSSWNMSVFNNTSGASLGVPGIYLGDVQTILGSYSGQFYINNTLVSPAPAIPIFVINAAGATQIGLAVGGQYARIQTINGLNWTITSNVPNPQGNAGGIGATYSNIVSIQQSGTGTIENHTQNYQLQAPTTSLLTGNFNLFADAIRVNKRRNGSLETQGINSYPVGIELGVYQDNNIIWTQVGALWQSDATNSLENFNGTTLIDVNAWSVLIVPSRFRTNDSEIVSYDVQPAVLSVGGGGFCWGFNRYIQVNADITGPGDGANNWNWYLAIPLNYITR